MDTQEIERGLKNRLGVFVNYLGIYSSDGLPFIRPDNYVKPTIFIANTLEGSADSSQMGHWVCFYIEHFPERRLIFFDSFGMNPSVYSKYFSEYISKYIYSDIYTFSIQLQPDNSVKCGLYVMFFVHFTSHHNINKFILHYNSVFGKSSKVDNDHYVTRYYLKNLVKKVDCHYWKTRGNRRVITYKECLNIAGMIVWFNLHWLYD